MLRENLAQTGKYRFEGIHKDLAGFPVQARMTAGWTEIEELAKQTPAARFYILYFDAHRKLDNEPECKKQLEKIIKILSRKNPDKILAVELPYHPDSLKNRFNVMFNNALHRQAFPGIKIIPLYDDTRRRSGTVYQDGYLTPAGQKLLAKKIENELRP
jgi:hypothetical protein